MEDLAESLDRRVVTVCSACGHTGTLASAGYKTVKRSVGLVVVLTLPKESDDYAISCSSGG